MKVQLILGMFRVFFRMSHKKCIKLEYNLIIAKKKHDTLPVKLREKKIISKFKFKLYKK